MNPKFIREVATKFFSNDIVAAASYIRARAREMFPHSH
jgi:hypothetical protein